MRRFSRPCTLFLVMTALLAGVRAPASAQSVAEPNTMTVTPFVATSFGVSQGLDSSLGLGVAIGYDLTRNLGFEFDFGHVFDIAGGDDNLDWSLTNVSGNVVYHFDVPRVTPYATLGLGWERSTPRFDIVDPMSGSSSRTEVAWNIGGGAKSELTDRIIARLDLRRFQVNDLAPDHWRLYGGLTFFVKR